jgi:uncharacterized damage-inducible protein DinB
VPTFSELLRYTEWADQTVWRAVADHPASEGDAVLRKLLLHIHVVQHLFLKVWRGEQVTSIPDESEFATLQAIRDYGQRYYAEAHTFANALDPAALDQPLVMPWAKLFEKRLGRSVETTTLGDTMFQVLNHTTYHRGQVNLRLRALGAEPPLVDYIAWAWLGKPGNA